MEFSRPIPQLGATWDMASRVGMRSEGGQRWSLRWTSLQMARSGLWASQPSRSRCLAWLEDNVTIVQEPIRSAAPASLDAVLHEPLMTCRSAESQALVSSMTKFPELLSKLLPPPHLQMAPTRQTSLVCLACSRQNAAAAKVQTRLFRAVYRIVRSTPPLRPRMPR